jgi:hypothetical protein
MKSSTRTALLIASALLAMFLSRVFHWPLPLVPEAPLGVQVGVAAIGVVMFFLVLFPLWLPAIVPARFVRFVSLVCAALLILAAVAAAALATMERAVSVYLSGVVVVSLCAALFHYRIGHRVAHNHAV